MIHIRKLIVTLLNITGAQSCAEHAAVHGSAAAADEELGDLLDVGGTELR